MNTNTLLDSLGIAGPGAGLAIGTSTHVGGATPIDVYSPIDGSLIQRVGTAMPAEVETGCQAAHGAFLFWRNIPGPRRGELVRQFGQLLREYKEELGALVTLEAGKIQSEAEGEVQEMIDVCDFATGLSRQLYGLTIQSERPQHRLMEQWHPLGAVGVISAFNFPVAVWSWNAALALVCGDSVVWKPSEKTPFCALACHNLLMRVIRDFDDAPDALSVVVNGGRVVGEALVDSPRLPLISATDQ